MGYFNKILVQILGTEKLVDITELDQDHYESFLEAMSKLREAYIRTAKELGRDTKLKKEIKITSNLLCGAHEHYQCKFRLKGNKCKCKDECDMQTK